MNCTGLLGIVYLVFIYTNMFNWQVSPVECFLEKANSGWSRSSSRGNSPGRSPVRYVDEQIQGFKVNLKPEKKSKFSSVVLKIRGIDQVAASYDSFFLSNMLCILLVPVCLSLVSSL